MGAFREFIPHSMHGLCRLCTCQWLYPRGEQIDTVGPEWGWTKVVRGGEGPGINPGGIFRFVSFLLKTYKQESVAKTCQTHQTRAQSYTWRSQHYSPCCSRQLIRRFFCRHQTNLQRVLRREKNTSALLLAARKINHYRNVVLPFT